MGAVVDAILADRKLGGAAKDCVTTEFAPGEIKFKDAAGKDRLLYGGDIFFEARLWFRPFLSSLVILRYEQVTTK